MKLIFIGTSVSCSTISGRVGRVKFGVSLTYVAMSPVGQICNITMSCKFLSNKGKYQVQMLKTRSWTTQVSCKVQSHLLVDNGLTELHSFKFGTSMEQVPKVGD